MAAPISQLKTVHQFCAFTPKIGFNSSSPKIVSSIVSKKQQILQQKGSRLVFRFGNEGSSSVPAETEKVLMDMEEELIGMRKLNENCKGVGGLVELLECLEREAIMGADHGKEPTDYNRRAQIFDKSSRVFQALKQTDPA